MPLTIAFLSDAGDLLFVKVSANASISVTVSLKVLGIIKQSTLSTASHLPWSTDRSREKQVRNL